MLICKQCRYKDAALDKWEWRWLWFWRGVWVGAVINTVGTILVLTFT